MSKAPHTVFFSWQIDTPNNSGRSLIERALQKAILRVGQGTDFEEAIRDDLVIDRDTKGVPGSPPIVETILQKIDQASIFVPDLTFVGKRDDGRPTPNPNVLIEYGWALKSLGHSRIVPIMNSAFGKPTSESMPFDMRHLRNPILFDCPTDIGQEERTKVREMLANKLERSIRNVFRSKEFKRDHLPFFGWWIYALKAMSDGQIVDVVGVFRVTEGVTQAKIVGGEAFYVVDGNISP
jgi:hypothetical protein